MAIFLNSKNSTAPNPAFRKLLSRFNDARYQFWTTRIYSLTLSDLLPKDKEKFFVYNGSTTSPPCEENTTWLVFQQPQNLSTSQISTLYQLYSTPRDIHASARRKLIDTYRKQEKLNGRQIYSSWDLTSAASLPLSSRCGIVAAATTMIVSVICNALF